MGLISTHQGAHNEGVSHGVSQGVSPSIDRMVVGVDFSDASLAAAAWAGRQLAPEAELVLVFVAATSDSRFALRDHVWGDDSSESDTEKETENDTESSLRGALHGLATLLGSARVTIELRVGDPATELARVADTHDADLIVVGGRPRTDAPLVGELLRRTPLPVLVVRDVSEGAPRTVLAALANDVAAPAVLRAAWQVARLCDASVAALHVIDDEERRLARATWKKRSVQGTSQRSLAADLRSGTEAWLERWLDSVEVPRARSITIIGEGDPVKEVASAARRTRAGMIVIGAPNETEGVARVNDGAALRAILRAAPCSVLVVPHPVTSRTSPPRRRANDRTRRRRAPLRVSPQDLDAELAPSPAARVGPECAA